MSKKDYSNYQGLTSKEVEANLAKYGENTLIKKKKLNPIVAFFRQFADPMVILLIIAAAISLTLAIVEHFQGGKSTTDLIISYVEPGIIMLVIILNSMLGAYQEVKSDQAVRALEKVNQVNATVIRDGKVQIIPANLLVPGDLVVLAAGDTINADGRLIEASNLEVVEASLTGESLPVSKVANLNAVDDKILANNKHLVYSGTYVTNGRATFVVEHTASETEIGKINSMIQKQNKNATPLQIKLNKLSKWFGYGGIILLFVSFILQIILNNVHSGNWTNSQVYTNALVTGISLAVAAIPEGLITFTTVLLSIGVSQMSKQKGLVKNLLAVETLGSASIICSDKTGTLTENKMTVVDAYRFRTLWSANKKEELFRPLAKYLALCNDAFITLEANNEWKEVGDPTETGLLRYSYSYGYKKEELLKEHPILATLPFDSNRKMHSVVFKEKDRMLLVTKGAPDVLLKRCNNLTIDDIKEINHQWADKSYRVLAVAKKVVKHSKIDFKDENDLEFVGLVAMIDPPRAEVANSIREAQGAGIKVVMITGDQVTTARAIAQNLGIYQDGDTCLEGKDLAKMSEEELRDKVEHISVYARVNPEDKLRIVQAWQSHQKVVAMTGDGVNDAPALKTSDIGCAMGITGTDVSKQAADLILVDDNFNTIVNSVRNGRLIFDKIKTVILNLLISSLTEILVMLIGMVAFFLAYKDYYPDGFYIFGASQLLWINLLTHGLPAIALGFVDSGKDVMKRKPFSKSESIFARGMGIELLWQSALVSLLSLISYALGAEWAIKNDPANLVKIASTTAFITMGVAASLNSINLMSDKSIFISSIKKYWPVILAASFSTLSTLFVVLVPQVAKVFRMYEGIYASNGILIWMSLPLALGLTIANEIKKIIIFIKGKQANKINLAHA